MVQSRFEPTTSRTAVRCSMNEFKRELNAYLSLQSAIMYSCRGIKLGNKAHIAGFLIFDSIVSVTML